MKKIYLIILSLLCSLTMVADEGMWLLKELNKQSAARMQELGFTFPIDSLYNESNASLKDAVVIFGGGCTGVAVSEKGLIFTNHHCGYGDIQKLSSVEHDYLRDGFVSHSFTEELPAQGLAVSFLQKTENVTKIVLADVTEDDDEVTRITKIQTASEKYLAENYGKSEFQRVNFVPFYANNQFYVVVYEVFKDVRLVFTPPSSVGKFGGETDNWMWPRHTGDFSVFRVYANKDNKATSYSADNVPYQPKYSVPVSVKGYEKGSYSMTVGYPGRTQRYIPSYAIEQKVESEHKPRIAVRGAKQDIWKKSMNANDAIRIKYASKYAGSSNYWKNAMGMNDAIAKRGVIESKQNLESQFTKWVNADAKRKAKYGNVLPELEENYKATDKAMANYTYLSETFFGGIEIVRIASTYNFVYGKDVAEREKMITSRLTSTYKDYEPKLDQELMPVLLELYAKSVPAEYLPSVYTTINKKFKGDYKKYADWVFAKTNLLNMESGVKALTNEKSIKAKTLEKDPAIELAESVNEIATKLATELRPYGANTQKGLRLYMEGLMAMSPDKAFSPDANFTQRLSYGSVGGYSPVDAVEYLYYSTEKGVLAKEKPGDPEFNVQPYILDKLKSKNFGRYGNSKGEMQVNFLSNNDITGGNSGSPVFDGQANLIGLAFDGNWEALSGDITFEPEYQRMISVDIRYVLYIIDNVMNCPRIIDELNIVE